MEGWLLKASGGKEAKGFSIGNAVSKWDKRYFVLRGGSTTLSYYKHERDADKGAGDDERPSVAPKSAEAAPAEVTDMQLFDLVADA